MSDDMSRRDLIKLGVTAAAVTATSTLAGCSSNDSSLPESNETSSYRVGESSVDLEQAIAGTILDVKVATPSFEYFPNVIYKKSPAFASGHYLILEIIQPASESRLPCILFINGGSFIRSDPSKHLYMRIKLAEAGYVVASVQYSVAPLVMFPQPLLDCKDAIRYLRANADNYNIDKENIGVVGESAGGYLAVMVGVTDGIPEFDSGEVYPEESCSVSVVVDLYGLSDLSITGNGFDGALAQSHTDLLSMESLFVNGMSFGGSLSRSIFDTPEVIEKSSPFTYIDELDPPFLIIHGAKDTIVSPVATKELEVKLHEKGVEVVRYIIPSAGHGTDEFNQPEVLNIIIDFLNSKLKMSAMQQ